jgi:phosphoribosylformimino-5-aminoimidazole carboxamide ribonucleotide (ProFAR) isomerase
MERRVTKEPAGRCDELAAALADEVILADISSDGRLEGVDVSSRVGRLRRGNNSDLRK